MTITPGQPPQPPTDEDFALVRSDLRYRQGGVLRKAAYIETAGGLVRIRTP